MERSRRICFDWEEFHWRENRNPLLIGWNNHKIDNYWVMFQNGEHGTVRKYRDEGKEWETMYFMVETFLPLDVYRIHIGDLIALFRKRNLVAKDVTFRWQWVTTYLKPYQIEDIHFHETDGDVKAVEYLLLLNNNHDNNAFIDINKDFFYNRY